MKNTVAQPAGRGMHFPGFTLRAGFQYAWLRWIFSVGYSAVVQRCSWGINRRRTCTTWSHQLYPGRLGRCSQYSCYRCMVAFRRPDLANRTIQNINFIQRFIWDIRNKRDTRCILVLLNAVSRKSAFSSGWVLVGFSGLKCDLGHAGLESLT